MSQMTLSIADAEQEVHGEPHGSIVHTVLAALSVDPETLEELRYAMRRFVPPEDRHDPLTFMSPGLCEEPYDAGICILDLAGRLIVSESTYSHVTRSGQIHYPGSTLSDPGIPYHFADEWMISDNPDGWRYLSDRRRRERQSNPPLDTRNVLYDQVIEFIVGQCELARGGTIGRADMWLPPSHWEWHELPNRIAEGEPPNVADAVAEIHARWLMTRRADLRGRMPREILLAKREAIDRDLADRQYQWSVRGECPPELWRESIAFRYGGYGSHEMVVYYEMVRHLLWTCWNLVADPQSGASASTVAQTIEQLAAIRDEWLNTPNFDAYGGQTPAAVIERERLRVPMMVSGADAMVDPDCPLCRMLAESSAPCFWHLDGCNLDEDFPFSFNGTHEQWQQEQRKWAELRAKWKDERERLVIDISESDSRDALFGPSKISNGQTGYFHTTISAAPRVELVSLRAHVEELIEDLGHVPEGQGWVDQLHRDFESLSEAASNPPSMLIGPVVLRCNEHLAAIGETHRNLAEQCAILRRQLSLLVLRFGGARP